MITPLETLFVNMDKKKQLKQLKQLEIMKTKNETKIENKLTSLLRDLIARKDLVYVESQMTELGYTTDRGVIKGFRACLEWLNLNPKINSLKFVFITKDESYKCVNVSVSNYLEVIEGLKQEELDNQIKEIPITVKEYRSLLGLYNATKTLLHYQELNKKDGIWNDMINWSLKRVQGIVKDLEFYNE